MTGKCGNRLDTIVFSTFGRRCLCMFVEVIILGTVKKVYVIDIGHSKDQSFTEKLVPD